jgi:hypothetical protein
VIRIAWVEMRTYVSSPRRQSAYTVAVGVRSKAAASLTVNSRCGSAAPASSLRMRFERDHYVRDEHVTSLAIGAGHFIESVTQLPLL